MPSHELRSFEYLDAFMAEALKNNKSILTGLIYLAYAGLFFPIMVSSVTLILLLAWCLYLLRPADIVSTFRNSYFQKIMIGLYGLMLIGMLYTENTANGLFVLEKKISLLLAPLLVLPAIEKTETEKDKLLYNIGMISVLSSVVMVVMAAFRLLVLGMEDAFYFEKVTPIHYVYYSLYFASGSLILLHFLFDRWVQQKSGWLWLALLYGYILLVLILVASKTGILAFGLASVWLLYKKIKNRKIFILAVVMLAVAGSLFLYANETTRSRFHGLGDYLSVLALDDFRGHEVYITDLNMRLLFWKISVVNVWRDNLAWLGTGTGDAQDYINSLYSKPQYDLAGYIGWDSHNQWIFAFIQLGLAGLAALGFLFFYLLRLAISRNDVAFMMFLIITLSFSFSESILESNKGIVFFSLLTTVLSSTAANGRNLLKRA